jgi:HD superfamily phosphodiesterase
VLENGLRLAPATGANVTLVALFAIFHDARRRNDGHDAGHGERGAQCAAAARAHEIIVWAAERSLAGFEPEFVTGWRAGAGSGVVRAAR